MERTQTPAHLSHQMEMPTKIGKEGKKTINFKIKWVTNINKWKIEQLNEQQSSQQCIILHMFTKRNNEMQMQRV